MRLGTFFGHNHHQDSPLCYHSISNRPVFKNRLHNVHPENFEKHLVYLRKRGVTLLGIEEYVEERLKGAKKISTVTFDDGYKNILEEAAPIMEALGVEFTIFINTSLLEGDVLWRDNIRTLMDNELVQEFDAYLKVEDPSMASAINWDIFYLSSKSNSVNSRRLANHLSSFLASRMESKDPYLKPEDLNADHGYMIGNHTHRHFRMSTLTKAEQQEEIIHARDILEKLKPAVCTIFGIPFGENGSFNQDTIDLVHELGFNGFFMTNQSQIGLRKPKIEVDHRGLYFSNRILPRDEPDFLPL